MCWWLQPNDIGVLSQIQVWRSWVFLKKIKILAKNQEKCTVKVLGLDKGGEFTLQEFTSFCKANGIRRQLITPIHLSKMV